MSDYTYGDIIINPTSEEAKNCICKEVYFSTAPNDCLKYANNDSKDHYGTLQGIVERNSLPFVINSDSDNSIHSGASIILKRESKPEYVPFESAREFLTAYEDSIKNEVNTRTANGTRLYLFGGIWISERSKDIDVYCMVTKVWDSGLVICSSKIGNDGFIDLNKIISWDELYESFTFLGGTPCGKLRR